MQRFELRLGEILLCFFLNFPATLYSLSDVSSAAKLSSVPLRYHCTGGSLYSDRTAKQEPSCADALRSPPPATLSPAEIHRPPLESDSCALPRLPSMFSIKNEDDAFDEMGAWFPDRFSSMFSQIYALPAPAPSASCLDCALQPPESPTLILSAAAYALQRQPLLHGSGGTGVSLVPRQPR